MSKVLREYLGDKLNLEGRAITSAEVEAKMRTRQYTEEQVQSVRQMLEKYESLQFAPVSGGNGGDLLEESRALLDRLEK
nr:hypothetical protein [Nitrospinaceae bacterium]NIW05589.1 hypothetical protein [Nitrospinaceae bacterium]NIX34128.1 hypothetical protein [Nitrospinaceae bacterium]NIY14886.1 hypothetical protein [Nitrospinaceae bacterium]